MNTTHRVFQHRLVTNRISHAAASSLFGACCLLAPVVSPEAATVRWTGLGASALWSDAANWDALQVPGNGDDLVFGGASAQPDSVFDLTRTFASLAFAADAQAFALHVQGGGAMLAFDGAGIRNLTAGTGPIRQDLFVDAGSAGGSIVFSGHSGVNLGDDPGLRPVNLTARGATTATAIGGHIVFQDDAATGTNTYDALRAEGAAAAGGVGGEIVFRGNAIATRTATVTVTGGTVIGAAGGQASFSDLARVDAIVNVLAGEGGGLGARADFSGQARASVYASIANKGASSATAGAQGITTFRGDSRLAGSVSNEAGGGAGFDGGQLEFRDRASHDTSGIDPSLGIVQIRNAGASLAGARGGSTVFRDDAAVLGASLLIVNAVQAEEPEAGSAGGTTAFLDRASAGQASIVNEGAAVAGALGGATRFAGNAVAGSAAIANNTSANGSGGLGGSTVFSNDANAQHATITNQGGFFSSDSAATRFTDRASAGQALITNEGGRAASAFGGVTSFDGSATADAATLVLAGGSTDRALGGFVVFYADTHAGSATVDVRAASVLGASGGRVVFYDRASADSAHFSVAGSPVDHVSGSEGGGVSFAGASSAADASFEVGGNRYAGGGVGSVRFNDASTAARASFTLVAGETRGGALSFEGADVANPASAGSAHITNQGSSTGAPRGLAIGGQTSFLAFSTAGSATITNEAGSGFGYTSFFADSTAGDASVVNLGGAAGEDGGSTQFSNSASAERAVIVNRAGARGSSGFDAAGVTRFVDQAHAGQARITAEGASSGSAIGGLIVFNGNADPGQATLIADGGTNGGTGGRIQFAGLTNASQARVILNAGTGAGSSGGELDISAISVAGIAIGSLEGGGVVNLGGKNLTLWSSTANTKFSGLLRDGGVGGGIGGSLSVTGGSTLTLTGANTYSGGTRIGDGLNAGSGKLVAANTAGSATGIGEVVVQRGGTLGGSGFVAGPVTLMAGGVIAPGDPVTLSLADSLTWNGGGVIRLVLGADSAGSDHVVMHSLLRGADGDFIFDLVDFGVIAGASYDLLSFASIAGFDAHDFSARGLVGSFELHDGRLEFTTAAVPEPGSAALLAMGLAILWRTRRRRAVGGSVAGH